MFTFTDEPTDWRSRAACLGADPNDMQPEVASPGEVELAKRVCLGCPVRRECRELALSQPGGAYGIHGGEWFGPPPRPAGVSLCSWCVEPAGGRKFCSTTCRVRAHRARERATVSA